MFDMLGPCAVRAGGAQTYCGRGLGDDPSFIVLGPGRERVQFMNGAALGALVPIYRAVIVAASPLLYIRD